VLFRSGVKTLLKNAKKSEYMAFMATLEGGAIELFGTTIPLGNCKVMIPEARLVQPIEEVEELTRAVKPADTINIDIEPKDHLVTFDYEKWPKKD